MSSNLTAEQLNYVTSTKYGSSSLIACAGSGKTRCIIERANYLISTNHCNSSELFIITFSRQTAQDIRQKIDNMEMDKQISKDNVCTIDSLARQFLILCDRPVNNVSCLSADWLKLLKADPLLFISTLQINNITPKHIFVDEAQDLNEVQYNILIKLNTLFSCSIHMIGDPNQSIYQFRNSNQKYLLDFELSNKYELTWNFRSKQSIVDLCQLIKPCQDDTGQSNSGHKETEFNKQDSVIVFYQYRNKSEFDSRILDIISEYKLKRCSDPMCSHCMSSCANDDKCFPGKHQANVTLCDRCILPCIHKVNDLSNIAICSPARKFRVTGLGSVFDMLRSNGFKVNQMYNESKDFNVDSSNSSGNNTSSAKKIKPNRINLISYHGTKGLEFETVIVLGAVNNLLHFDYTGFNQTDHDNDKCLLYVVCSRPTHNLHVIVHNGARDINDANYFSRFSNHFNTISKVTLFDQSKLIEDSEVAKYFNTATGFRSGGSVICINTSDIMNQIDPIHYRDIDDYINTRALTDKSISQIFIANNVSRERNEALFGQFCELLFYFFNRFAPNSHSNLRYLKLLDSVNSILEPNVGIMDDKNYNKFKKYFENHKIFADSIIDKCSPDYEFFLLLDQKCTSNCECYNKAVCKQVRSWVHKCEQQKTIFINYSMRKVLDDNCDHIRESKEYVLKYVHNVHNMQQKNEMIIGHLFYLMRVQYGISINHKYYCKRYCYDKDFLIMNPNNRMMYDKIIDFSVAYEPQGVSGINSGQDMITNLTNLTSFDLQNITVSLKGVPDHFEDNYNVICEIKCTKDTKLEHYIQLILYYLMKNRDMHGCIVDWNVKYKIINLLLGTIETGVIAVTQEFLDGLLGKVKCVEAYIDE